MSDVASILEHDAEPLTGVNPPASPHIVYRADDYSTLRHKMLRHLAELFPEWNAVLADNRGQQDMGVAFVELFAYLADVLGFYQDCRANEAFPRTATLRTSLIDLCALIDYRIPAGASASTLQVFLAADGEAGTVPAGFQVKTEARDGEPARIFETGRALAVDAARNRLRLRGYDRSQRVLNPLGLSPPAASELLDEGYDGLKAGSFVVFSVPGADRAVQLTAVTTEDERRRIHWEPAALANAGLPVADLVVHGKPAQTMALASKERADEITAGQISVRMQVANAFTQGNPVLFVSEGLREPARILSASGYQISWNRGFTTSLRRSRTTVYRGTSVGHTHDTLRRGALKITRHVSTIDPKPGDHLLAVDAAGVERVMVAAVDGSTIFLAEPLLRACRPVDQGIGHPTVELYYVRLPGEGVSSPSTGIGVAPRVLNGTETVLTLDDAYDGLEPGAVLALSDGPRQRTNRVDKTEVDDEGRTTLYLKSPVGAPFEEANLTLYGPFEHAMRLADHDRPTESTVAGATGLDLHGIVEGLKPGDYLVVEGGGRAEGARLSSLTYYGGHTLVTFTGQLEHAYPLADTVVYGNVTKVSHGETVVETVLGSGDQSQPHQRFTLQRHPVTYVHDAEGWRGVANTLEVFVGDERWQEVRDLAASGPGDRHYRVAIDDEEVMTVHFGDGRHGARPTTGRDNVRARYRVGLGAGGNVGARAIAKMPQALPFLDATVNPLAAGGGEDREAPERTKRLAPMTVRTLDRAVSLADYADLALTYAGIAKARADWDWEEGRRVIRLTVAAAGGQPLAPTLKDDLRAFLDARRSPHHRLRLREHRRWPVRLELDLRVLPEFLRMETRVRLEEALGAGLTAAGERGYFHFDRLELGQDLYLSEIYALAEAVRGVDHLVVRVFRPAGDTAGAPLRDVIRVPADAVASGGHPSDAAIGLLHVRPTGGIL